MHKCPLHVKNSSELLKQSAAVVQCPFKHFLGAGAFHPTCKTSHYFARILVYSSVTLLAFAGIM